VYGMPRAVIDANMADIVLPLDKITEEIMKIL
jgi:chemotaxis response regulator CheB